MIGADLLMGDALVANTQTKLGVVIGDAYAQPAERITVEL